jgi:hypothetical protein
MALSDKLKERAERAKQKEAAEERRIEQAGDKVQAYAEEYNDKVIADARKRQQHGSKRKHPGA